MSLRTARTRLKRFSSESAVTPLLPTEVGFIDPHAMQGLQGYEAQQGNRLARFSSCLISDNLANNRSILSYSKPQSHDGWSRDVTSIACHAQRGIVREV